MSSTIKRREIKPLVASSGQVKTKNATSYKVTRPIQSSKSADAHPWSGFGEAILSPLPADIRYNIQKFFSSLGDAISSFFGDGKLKKISGGRKRI